MVAAALAAARGGGEQLDGQASLAKARDEVPSKVVQVGARERHRHLAEDGVVAVVDGRRAAAAAAHAAKLGAEEEVRRERVLQKEAPSERPAADGVVLDVADRRPDDSKANALVPAASCERGRGRDSERATEAGGESTTAGRGKRKGGGKAGRAAIVCGDGTA